MKKQFLVNLLIILLLFVSCSTVSVSDSEQIVSTAITLADALEKRGEYESAIQTYEKAYSSAKDYRLIYNLAILQGKTGDLQKAAETSLKAFADFPSRISFLENATKFYELDKDYENAQQVYLKILELNPYSSGNALKLISLYEQMNNSDKAYELALEMWNKGLMNSSFLDILVRYDAETWEKYRTIVN